MIYGVGVVGNLVFTASGDGTVKKFDADTLLQLDTILGELASSCPVINF